jgi:ferredoxin
MALISKKIVLHFPVKIADKPIVLNLVKNFNLDFNILKASINPNEEGVLILELSGERQNYNKGLEYLKEVGVTIEPLSKDIIRNEKRCSHCGVCVPICPSGAFSIEEKTRKILFDNKKCIVCGMCIKICPTRAMEEHV